jgi:hypothetical protein
MDESPGYNAATASADSRRLVVSAYKEDVAMREPLMTGSPRITHGLIAVWAEGRTRFGPHRWARPSSETSIGASRSNVATMSTIVATHTLPAECVLVEPVSKGQPDTVCADGRDAEVVVALEVAAPTGDQHSRPI